MYHILVMSMEHVRADHPWLWDFIPCWNLPCRIHQNQISNSNQYPLSVSLTLTLLHQLQSWEFFRMLDTNTESGELRTAFHEITREPRACTKIGLISGLRMFSFSLRLTCYACWDWESWVLWACLTWFLVLFFPYMEQYSGTEATTSAVMVSSLYIIPMYSYIMLCFNPLFTQFPP